MATPWNSRAPLGRARIRNTCNSDRGGFLAHQQWTTVNPCCRRAQHVVASRKRWHDLVPARSTGTGRRARGFENGRTMAHRVRQEASRRPGDRVRSSSMRTSIGHVASPLLAGGWVDATCPRVACVVEISSGRVGAGPVSGAIRLGRVDGSYSGRWGGTRTEEQRGSVVGFARTGGRR